MNINIETSQINNHLVLKTNKSVKEIVYEAKICKQDFFSINEYNICYSITKIPFYLNFYNIIVDTDFIVLDEETELENDGDKEEALVFEYKSNEMFLTLNDFLFDFNTPKQFIFNVLETYSFLLNSLIQLNDNNICFFNLSYENIVFDIFNHNDNPLLQNFGNSLDISELNETYITNIIEHTTDFTNKPIEIHILFYLIYNNLNTLSYAFIEEITDIFMKNISVLSLFSQSYKNEFKKECINSLQKYINKNKSDIINDILENYTTWDNYSLSILYLHIIGNVLRIFSLKGTFISKLTIQLAKNICPEPSKRESLSETKIKYEELFSEFIDWRFINSIPIEKLNILYKVLSI
jgi:hypothetical protein